MPTTKDTLHSASRSAHDGVEAGRRLAKRAAHGLDDSSHDLAAKVDSVINRAEDMARDSLSWMRDGSDRVRSRVASASEASVGYVRENPVRSVVAAAATGALVYALVSALRGRREH